MIRSLHIQHQKPFRPLDLHQPRQDQCPAFPEIMRRLPVFGEGAFEGCDGGVVGVGVGEGLGGEGEVGEDFGGGRPGFFGAVGFGGVF